MEFTAAIICNLQHFTPNVAGVLNREAEFFTFLPGRPNDQTECFHT